MWNDRIDLMKEFGTSNAYQFWDESFLNFLLQEFQHVQVTVIALFACWVMCPGDKSFLPVQPGLCSLVSFPYFPLDLYWPPFFSLLLGVSWF